MPLRSRKREGKNRGRDEQLLESSGLLSSEDVFPDDPVAVDVEADEQDDRGGEYHALRLLAAVPGPLIAAGTFVPTFLAIFFGLSYVVGSLLGTGSSTSAPVPSATALSPSPGTQAMSPPISEAPRDPFVPPRGFDVPSARSGDRLTRPDDPEPAIESTGPTLPPAQSRPAVSPVPEPRPGDGAPPRQPRPAVLNATAEQAPASEARTGRDWTRAAGFADRESASRLASSIQQQGYPVEIRHEQSSTHPWVVWIGAQPRGGERRR